MYVYTYIYIFKFIYIYINMYDLFKWLCIGTTPLTFPQVSHAAWVSRPACSGCAWWFTWSRWWEERGWWSSHPSRCFASIPGLCGLLASSVQLDCIPLWDWDIMIKENWNSDLTEQVDFLQGLTFCCVLLAGHDYTSGCIGLIAGKEQIYTSLIQSSQIYISHPQVLYVYIYEINLYSSLAETCCVLCWEILWAL